MGRKIIVLIIITILLNSCCANKITSNDKEYWNKEIYGEEPFLKNQEPAIKVVLVDYYNKIGYILPKQENQNIKKRFTPTIENIRLAEQRLSQKLESIDINPKDKYRQYLGTIEDGKKIILINLIEVKNACRDKSLNSYLLDKYFFTNAAHEDDIWYYSIPIN